MFRITELWRSNLHVRRRAGDHHGGEPLVSGVPFFHLIPMRIVNDTKIETLDNTLGYCDEQCFHVLGVLNEVFLRNDIDQGSNGKVSSILWT